MYYRLFILWFFSFVSIFIHAQPRSQNLIYIDKKGIVRYTSNKKEAAFFGVNYTVPFAYGYRSHKRLSVDLEKAIDADVYHFQRLGLNAFRVHVWDVEISDSLGNLLQNEHLRLFDYLISQLKKRNIKILVTPIAFWGNGWPEKDLPTPGFSTVYGKRGAVTLEPAIKAQENYLKQFFKHVNPYTKLSYRDDPDIIATEINNEPVHSGPKEKATEYINRLIGAIRSTGWTKPIFYNISESPAYADAVVKSKAEGYSFQWYPTGLVANRSLQGNFLPHVDKYAIPFADTIQAFKNKPLMVYEFDAGDVHHSVMYPAMARSFRTAGFWWATQFAYDPLATAYGNTEYGTHYVNLAYTPSKAISLLIASKLFQKVPRFKNYGSFPANTSFDDFTLDYNNDRSEMNSTDEFYYSNSTGSLPKSSAALKHIAGVGNSPVIEYEGTGAYFLDKLDDGVWRLEVMPDAIQIRDPYEKPSPQKEVVRIQSKLNLMKVNLPHIQSDFVLTPLNEGNNYSTQALRNTFSVQPGVYLVQSKKMQQTGSKKNFSRDYFAPQPFSNETYINHSPLTEVTAGKSFLIISTIVGIDSADKVSLELRNSSNKWKTVDLVQKKSYEYTAEVPIDIITPGIINYRIIIKKGNQFITFPGAHKGDPYAWDNYINESWQTIVKPATAPIPLFEPATDRNKLSLYNPEWRHNSFEYVVNENGNLVLRMNNNDTAGRPMGFQFYFADKISGRKEEAASHANLSIKARAVSEASLNLKVSIITSDAQAFSKTISLSGELKEFTIPLSSLQQDAFYLLPRPYPGFHPLKFKGPGGEKFNIADAEKLEISFEENKLLSAGKKIIEIEAVELKK